MANIYWSDLTLPTLEENLALDEALLLQAEDGGPEVLRCWEWPTPAVVLGAAGRIRDEVNIEQCQEDGIPIHRRASGGGTVLLNRGCLLFSLILRFDRDPSLQHIPSSYKFILGKLVDALAAAADGVAFQGQSDLTLNDRKFSGNSQQRKRHNVLHHGTLLYAFDAGGLGRYLRSPPRQPEYRGGRSHEAFLVNLPMGVGELRRMLRGVWEAEDEMPDWPGDVVMALVAEKYGTREWVERR